MEEIARVYAGALFEAAKEDGKLDVIREQLRELTEALEANADMRVFLFSPYFSSQEKIDGLHKAISDADPQLVNFLDLLNERHRMPAVFRIRRRFDELWAKENRRLAVVVTTAVPLDDEIIERIGKEIEGQTGQTVELSSRVDEHILGGLVLQVGNMVLDASIHNRLEKLRKSVAQAA